MLEISFFLKFKMVSSQAVKFLSSEFSWRLNFSSVGRLIKSRKALQNLTW